MSRLALKVSARSIMKSCGPSSAASAAAWLIEHGLDVLCDCTLAIALIKALGPPAKPIRHPVMA